MPLVRALIAIAIIFLIVVLIAVSCSTYQKLKTTTMVRPQASLEAETESGKEIPDARWQVAPKDPVAITIRPAARLEPEEASLIGSRVIGGSELALYVFLNEEGGKSVLCNARASRLEWEGGSANAQTVIVGKTLYSCFPVPEKALVQERLVVYP